MIAGKEKPNQFHIILVDQWTLDSYAKTVKRINGTFRSVTE